MAIGLGRIFGIRLPFNFASPYKATSIIDFWRRWHITLSRFLRDYLYISLGGNRGGPVRRNVNVFTTMLIGGFWHGAGWNFLLWGGLHGLFIVINHGRRKLFPGLVVPPVVGWLVTFSLVTIAWVPFRAETLDATLAIWSGMFGFGSSASGSFDVSNRVSDMWLPLAGAVVLLMPNTQQIMRRARPGLRTPGYPSPYTVNGFWPDGFPLWSGGWISAVLTACALIACMLHFNNVSEFIYFRF